MRTPRILVVDDNVMNIELATYVLEQDGFEVASAVDAISAASKVRMFRPDLILMDIQLPGTSGLAMTDHLKLDPENRHIVVIAFTAYAMKGDEATLRAAGCDGYIAKPFDVATLAAQVRDHLSALS